MGSAIIGRMRCGEPECAFEGAHVKQSEKCIYRFCPECGTQTFAKTAKQQANMRKAMRPVDAPPAPAAAPTATAPSGSEAAAPLAVAEPKAPVPVPAAKPATATATAPAAPKRSGLFGW